MLGMDPIGTPRLIETPPGCERNTHATSLVFDLTFHVVECTSLGNRANTRCVVDADRERLVGDHLHAVASAELNGCGIRCGCENILVQICPEKATIQPVCDRHVPGSMEAVVFIDPERSEFKPVASIRVETEMPKSNTADNFEPTSRINGEDEVIVTCDGAEFYGRFRKEKRFSLRRGHDLMNPGRTKTVECAPWHVINAGCTDDVEQVCGKCPNWACCQECTCILVGLRMKELFEHEASV